MILPEPPSRSTVHAAGLAWATRTWGRPGGRPVLLVHGVTSDGGIWWRVGPAIAARGRRVVAVDLPGHGRTGGWTGRHRFADTAADLAAFVRESGLDDPALAIVGHSWGAMVVAELPAAGICPATLVLLDPPALERSELEALMDDPTERPYATVAEARAAVRAAYPDWPEGDVDAKAEALRTFDPEAVRTVLLDNGAWDAGLAALRHPAAATVDAWLVRGEWASGGLIPDARLAPIVEQLGADRVVTIPGAPHSPQRTHPEATIAAIERALGD